MKTFLQKTILCAACSIFAIHANSQNTWLQRASLTALNGREGAAAFSIGHYGYIGGGQISSGFTNDFWRWNQDSNTWTAVTNYPGAGRAFMTAFSIGGNAYCGLGYTGSGVTNDFWEYDTATNSWTQKASFPGLARYYASVFVIGTNAYVGCGDPGGAPYYKDIWMYSSTTDTWTQVANFGGGDRSGTFAFSLNGYGYEGAGGDGSIDYNDLWQYNPTTNSWTSMASLPITGSQIDVSISFVIDTMAFVGTGYTSIGGPDTRDFWSYSVSTNTWGHIATLPGVSRGFGVGFSIGKEGYAGTGVDSVGGLLTDYWQYSPYTDAGVASIKGGYGDITAYPNPNNGIFTIQSSVNIGQSSVDIYNVIGQNVYSSVLNLSQGGPVEINMSDRAAGVYFYRISKTGGSLLGEGKIVIEK